MMVKATRIGAIIAVALVISTGVAAQTTPPTPIPQPPGTIGPSGPVQVSVVPVPDPTVLTTDQIRREIAALKEILVNVIDGKFQVITTRLDGSDKAVALLQEATDKQPERTQAAVDTLKALTDEKFGGVQKQFEERDVRIEQQALATKTAVDAALQAAEKSVNDKNESAAEAIAKSETSTAKQIDGQGALITAGNEAKQSQIDDLKARVQAIESRSEGQTIQQKDTGDNWALIIAAIGAFVAVAMMVIVLTRGAPIRNRTT